jgi:hypothetical protein
VNCKTEDAVLLASAREAWAIRFDGSDSLIDRMIALCKEILIV